MVSISIPRLNISVATSIGIRPLVKLISTFSLCDCTRSLCISSTVKPFCFSIRVKTFTFCFLLQKMRTLLKGVLVNKYFTNGSFCSSYTTKALCTIFSGGREIAILISTGSIRICWANFRILGGMVAENNKVCLLEGNCVIILLISSWKPISSIRSASSSTKNSKPFMDT